MNPFSYLLIGILIVGIFFNRSLKKYYMFVFTVTGIVELYVLQGDFLIIIVDYHTINIDYRVFMHLLLICLSLAVLSIYHTKRKLIYIALLFLASVVMGIVLEMLMPLEIKIFANRNIAWDSYYMWGIGEEYPAITERTLFWGVKLFSYLLAVVVSKSLFTVEDFKKIATGIINIGLIMMPLGLFELITKQRGLNVVDDFTTAFFGVGYRNSILIREGHVALKGFSTETGNYAQALGHLGILLVIESSYNPRRNRIWILLTGIMLIVSMAFTGLYFLVILVFLYFVYQQKGKGKKLPIRGILVGSLAVFLLLYLGMKLFPDIYFVKRLNDTFNQLSYVMKGDIKGYGVITSEMIRLSSLRDSMLWFIKRPLFGLGFGTTQCCSGLGSSLVNIGCIGFFFWWMLNLQEQQGYQKGTNKSEMILAVALITVMNLFVADISMLSSIVSFVIIALILSGGSLKEVEK